MNQSSCLIFGEPELLLKIECNFLFWNVNNSPLDLLEMVGFLQFCLPPKMEFAVKNVPEPALEQR